MQVELSQDTINRLIDIANQHVGFVDDADEVDMYDPRSVYGSDADSAYWDGTYAGEGDLARQILTEIGVEWK